MKFYAVKKGRKIGVYKTWDECRHQVDGYSGAQYKSFGTERDALAYLSEGHQDVSDVSSLLSVWTDGACSGNGTSSAKAGIGVYFGEDDIHNLSESFTIGRCTNQRAEVHAVIRALEVVGDSVDVIIYTDSMYTINSMTDWIYSWLKTNWKNNTVTNRDLLERLHNLITSRKGRTVFEHVRGHRGILGNERADNLAVQGSLL